MDNLYLCITLLFPDNEGGPRYSGFFTPPSRVTCQQSSSQEHVPAAPAASGPGPMPAIRSKTFDQMPFPFEPGDLPGLKKENVDNTVITPAARVSQIGAFMDCGLHASTVSVRVL